MENVRSSTTGEYHDVLVCNCPKSLTPNATLYKTVLPLGGKACNIEQEGDITNCEGQLKCGYCINNTLFMR
jgi:hypothetical protein